MHNEQSDEKKIPFTIASNIFKYLGINLGKSLKISFIMNENYKSLKEEINEH
jgi:hypothetical protein